MMQQMAREEDKQTHASKVKKKIFKALKTTNAGKRSATFDISDQVQMEMALNEASEKVFDSNMAR